MCGCGRPSTSSPGRRCRRCAADGVRRTPPPASRRGSTRRSGRSSTPKAHRARAAPSGRRVGLPRRADRSSSGSVGMAVSEVADEQGLVARSARRCSSHAGDRARASGQATPERDEVGHPERVVAVQQPRRRRGLRALRRRRAHRDADRPSTISSSARPGSRCSRTSASPRSRAPARTSSYPGRPARRGRPAPSPAPDAAFTERQHGPLAGAVRHRRQRRRRRRRRRGRRRASGSAGPAGLVEEAAADREAERRRRGAGLGRAPVVPRRTSSGRPGSQAPPVSSPPTTTTTSGTEPVASVRAETAVARRPAATSSRPVRLAQEQRWVRADHGGDDHRRAIAPPPGPLARAGTAGDPAAEAKRSRRRAPPPGQTRAAGASCSVVPRCPRHAGAADRGARGLRDEQQRDRRRRRRPSWVGRDGLAAGHRDRTSRSLPGRVPPNSAVEML